MPPGDPVGDGVGRVAAVEDGVEVPAVEEAVVGPGGVPVGVAFGLRHHRGDDVHQAHLRRLRPGADRRHRQAVGEQQVVAGGERQGRIGEAGGVDGELVAQVGGAPGLVVGHVGGHPVAEATRRRGPGVVGEGVGGLPAPPAAPVLERLGQVPVVEGGHGRDARLEEGVDQPLVEVEAPGVGLAPAGGLDPRPGHREPVGVDAEVPHQRQVLAPPVVVVAGDGASSPPRTRPGVAREAVPDRRAPAVLGGGALDLQRRGGDPEGEARWEAARHGTATSGSPGGGPALPLPRRASSSVRTSWARSSVMG